MWTGILVTLFIFCALGWYFQSKADMVEGVRKTAHNLYIFVAALYDEASSWDNLKKLIEANPSLIKTVEDSRVYWIDPQFPLFMFTVTKNNLDDNFWITVSGSANGTNKEYFGFMLVVYDIEETWSIQLRDGLAGCKVTRKTWQLAYTLRKLLKSLFKESVISLNGITYNTKLY